MGTSVLEVVNTVVYKEKNFLFDVAKRVLHYDLDLGKETTETGVYPGVLKLTPPLLRKASFDLL